MSRRGVGDADAGEAIRSPHPCGTAVSRIPLLAKYSQLNRDGEMEMEGRLVCAGALAGGSNAKLNALISSYING